MSGLGWCKIQDIRGQVMTSIAEILMPPSARGHLRPLDIRHDLGAVADLVELCFADTLDPDGRSYLRQMRDAARVAALWGWTGLFGESLSSSQTGYVWEEERRIVGNLSLYSVETLGRRCIMIANVAVHPDFRGRGIARALMATAIENGRSRGAVSAMLQVRDDNPIACHLYTSMGFVESARRTTWLNSREYERFTPPVGITLGSRRARDWPLQRAWLGSLYPAELRWHIPLNLRLLKPGLEGGLYRLFSLDYPRHWSVYRQGLLAGVLTYQEMDGYVDALWLAVSSPVDELALRGLLSYARQHLPARQPLTLNLPAEMVPQVIRGAGFYPQQTLIWMEYRYPASASF